ncbi:RNA 2',3'-cyclic phosphodiesterase [Marinobacterium sp. YM272]|uniref:RNA 2',3'-cyclic phosphodiesterase n=1 Tax=Marinobacterium sp. YM272 TaxID=3421654 RepID=UPI003D7FF68C
MNSTRLFLAIDLPETLEACIARRQQEVRGLRWSAPEQLHLTLAFIGRLGPEKMVALDEVLSRITLDPFELQFDRVDTFAHRTLWMGCGPSAPIQALHQLLRESLESVDIATEKQPFRPHVTLARAQEPLTNAQIRQLETALLPEPLSMTVDQFALKNSILTGKAPLHQVIRLYGERRAEAG